MIRVSVLLPVPTEHPFTYEAPEGTPVGVRARVSLGGREVVGYVVGVGGADDTAAAELKPVLEILDPAPVFTPDLIDLTRAVARECLVPWYRALEAALPAGLKFRAGPPPRSATLRVLRLALPLEKARAHLAQDKRTSEAHRTAIEILAEQPEALTAADLARKIGRTPAVVRTLERRGLVEAVRKPRPKVDPAEIPVPPKPEKLTPDQERALAAIGAGGGYRFVLIEGATGAGKTEVYLRAIEATLAAGRGAIVLVPEISLTPQALARFTARLGDEVAVLHSALAPAERYEAWRRLLEGRARVALGPRSAVFAPVADLGLVILDEAHESAYKQNEAPRYDARRVAELRARAAANGRGVPLVFGTATPTVEMIEACARAGPHGSRAEGPAYRVAMRRRVAGADPIVEVVDMRKEILAGNVSIFSRALTRRLRETLARGGQAVLFLNRLGHSPFVFCRACGRAIRCDDCDLALVYHRRHRNLRCHGCEKRLPLPKDCPACGDKRLRPLGAGTERVAREVGRVAPKARVLRLDSDTTAARGSHHEILSRFARRKADVLVGTQMVGKGHDLPGVDLVGVVLAESTLHMPDFRAAERTFALVRQAIGRAGRRVRRADEEPAVAVVQTYCPDDPVIERAAAGDLDGFLTAERKRRKELGLPPFRRLVVAHLRSTNEHAVARAAERLADLLRDRLAVGGFAGETAGTEKGEGGEGPAAEVVGPAPSPIERLRGKHRWQVRLFLPPGTDPAPLGLLELAARALSKVRGRSAGGGGGRVEVIWDVDPLDLL